MTIDHITYYENDKNESDDAEFNKSFESDDILKPWIFVNDGFCCCFSIVEDIQSFFKPKWRMFDFF